MTTTITPETITSDRALDVLIRARDEGREFTGIGVPYGETIDLWGQRERFEPGSIDLNRDDVPTLVLWRHDEPIGTITSGKDTPEGYEITGRLSDTPRGREAATLLKDGVITRMSIGFRPEEYRIEHEGEPTDPETIVHTKVRALEFSLVPFPAYSNAKITTVRHSNPHTEKGATMNNAPALTRADITPLEEHLQDLERSVKGLELNTSAAPSEPRWRSMGAYLKAVAAGEEDALEFHRAFTGQTSNGAIKNETYLGEFIQWVQDRRYLVNLFDRGALPATGMSVDYAQLTDNTLKAGKQSAEGANLPGPGKVALTTKSAPIETYGGWTELSRQVIERSNLPYLDTVMKALGLAYAKATNDALRAKILKVIADRANSALTLADTKVYGWRDAIIDASEHYTENGFNLEGLLVSKDVFKELQRLEYASVPAMKVNSADEFTGTLNLPKADGDLATVPVHCLFGEVPEKTATFYDSAAIKTLENSNSPTQLQDDNIVNLSKQFSLYGYMSVIDPFPQAILPIKLGTPAAA